MSDNLQGGYNQGGGRVRVHTLWGIITLLLFFLSKTLENNFNSEFMFAIVITSAVFWACYGIIFGG